MRDRSVYRACLERSVALATTSRTAYEALSLVKTRAGIEAAANLWALLVDPQSASLIRETGENEARALDLFFHYRDKTWGVVDCASLVEMEEAGCRQAFACDHHFVEASRQRGFEVLP